MNELKKFKFVFVVLVFVLVFVFSACGQKEVNVESEKNMLGKDIELNVSEEKKEVSVGEKKPSKESCDKFFGKKSVLIKHYNFQGLNLTRKQFKNREIEGWCLYRKVGNDYQTIGSGSILGLGGVELLTLTKNKYLIYEERCGVPCAKISALNIFDFNDNRVLNDSSVWEVSQDNEWFIDYSYGLYGGIHNDYLIQATNLNTFETVEFAENHCKGKRGECDFTVVASRINNYVDNAKGVVKIPFIDRITGEKVYRTFDMSDNFKEI